MTQRLAALAARARSRRCSRPARIRERRRRRSPVDGGAGCDRWTMPRTAWGDPDLQGMWPIDKLNGTPLQRPATFGERRLLTDEEFAERSAAARGAQRALRRRDQEQQDGHRPLGRDGPAEPAHVADLEPANGRLPALTAEGERKSATMTSSWSNIPFDKVSDFNPLDRCITRGLPASMFPFMYNSGIEIMQAPGYVVIRLELIHETRIVPLDGRAAARAARSASGSASRAAAGTATRSSIETTNFNGESPMTIVGPGGKPVPTSERCASSSGSRAPPPTRSTTRSRSRIP